MKTATRLGLPRKDLMYLVLKLLAGTVRHRATATGPTGSSAR